MIIVPRRLLAARMTMAIREGLQMERRAFLTALLGGVLAATAAGATSIDERPAAATGALDAQEAEFMQGPPQPRAPGAATVPARHGAPRPPRRKNWHRYRQRNRRPLPPPPRHRGR